LKEELKHEFKTFRESLERELRTEIRELRTDVREVKKGMDFINKAFEDIKKEFEALSKENAELKRENASLLQSHEKLLKAMKETEARLVHCEQYSRNANLEIKGIPKQENENVSDTVKKVGDLIGSPIAADDIEVCHRVPTRNSESNIQFRSRARRDAVLEAAKKKRISNKDLGSTASAPIYINEHLCPVLKRLLGMSVAKKRECDWKYVWVRNGRIFARKTDNAPILKITHADDLEKIR
ncbi:unnamed protein product, partial [Ixodes hexagonus]